MITVHILIGELSDFVFLRSIFKFDITDPDQIRTSSSNSHFYSAALWHGNLLHNRSFGLFCLLFFFYNYLIAQKRFPPSWVLISEDHITG